MQKLIYQITNKFFMNEVELDLIESSKTKYKVIFDVGCYSFLQKIFNIKLKNNKIILSFIKSKCKKIYKRCYQIRE